MKKCYVLIGLMILLGIRIASASQYISKVYEFCPAPGQFTNVLPLYETGDNAQSMCAKADACLKNHNQELISLGGWGGYVVFGFDHEIVNCPGEYDIKILGNAFYAAANPNQNGRRCGNSEPGVVWVSRDENGNGQPDDAWYELVGSEYASSNTRRNYALTYYRTPLGHIATPDSAYRFLTDTTYIRWKDIDNKMGYMSKNSTHTQNYYPMWMPDSVEFSGTLLPSNAVDESGVGSYYVSYCYDWGYADNMPNEDAQHPELHASEFMLDWAIDSLGRFVHLPGIHFVKVSTGTNQSNGWLGESSTEVLDAWDMHPQAVKGHAICATFENRPLQINLATPDSFWCGPSALKSGINSWTSGTYTFYTYNDDQYGASYYYAFVVSNETESISSGYTEPYRSASGGAYEGSNFAVWSSDFYGGNTITLAHDTIIPGCFINNNAYTVHSMKYGDGYARAFSSTDTLQLLIIGINHGQNVDTVIVNLAAAGFFISQWTYVDLTSLGRVDAVKLAMIGTDNSYGYLNTPSYVCIDNFGANRPAGYQAPPLESFTGTGVPNVESVATPQKLIRRGQLLIIQDGKVYNAQGHWVR